MKIEYLADGSILKKLSPLPDVPFYSDWLKILLMRGAATEIESIDPETKEHKISIKPHGRETLQSAVLVDNQVGIVCVGCGALIFNNIMSVSRSDKTRNHEQIRIGGIIQLPDEQVVDPTTILRKWRRMPVAKKGIGCAACQAKFHDLTQEAAQENETREEIAAALARLAVKKSRIEGTFGVVPQFGDRKDCIHGLGSYCAVCFKQPASTVGIRLPSPYSAFIDVFVGYVREEE